MKHLKLTLSVLLIVTVLVASGFVLSELLSTSKYTTTQDSSAGIKDKPIVGIIRYDAWSPNIYAGMKAANSKVPTPDQLLLKSQWHYRWPSFATGIANELITLNEDNQAVIDQQIKYSVQAGIDYWAFDWYQFWWMDTKTDSGYNYALDRYMVSPNKKDINFALTLMGKSSMGKPEEWETKTVPKLIKYLKDPKYQKVLDNRPLIYIFDSTSLFAFFNCGNYKTTDEACKDFTTTTVKNKLEALRKQVIASGLANPYIVGMVWDPSAKINQSMGLDAISAYTAQQVSPQYPEGRTYADLIEANKVFRESAKAVGTKVIPVVNLGFDRRPHWVNTAEPHNTWYAAGTNTQIANNLQMTIEWLGKNKTIAESNSILIYALNEYTEGGWLGPTVEDGDARVKAIAGVLKKNIKYLAPVVTSIGVNVIDSNWYGWIMGTNFSSNMVVELYDESGAKLGSEIDVNLNSNDNKSATFRLPINSNINCNKTKSCKITAVLKDSFSGESYRFEITLGNLNQSTVPKITKAGLSTSDSSRVIWIQGTNLSQALKVRVFDSKGKRFGSDLSLSSDNRLSYLTLPMPTKWPSSCGAKKTCIVYINLITSSGKISNSYKLILSK